VAVKKSLCSKWFPISRGAWVRWESTAKLPVPLGATLWASNRVNVLDQFNYATMALNPDFHGFSTIMTVTFDDAVTLVANQADYGDFFGPLLIDSPLTATLPYGPTTGQPPQSREVLLANRDYGPTQQWSEFTIAESQDTASGKR
jgi:hypothetical protein